MVKWLLSVANKNDLFLTQFDVKTAFLYSDIKNPVYLSIPDGLISEENKNMVLFLQRSIYGLKTSAKNWFDLLHTHLQPIKFRCLYRKIDEFGNSVLVITYVDDILIAANKKHMLVDFENDMKSSFIIKANFNPTFFLGLEIYRNRAEKIIRVSQINYINKILTKFGMMQANGSDVPMETNLKLERDSSGKMILNTDL